MKWKESFKNLFRDSRYSLGYTLLLLFLSFLANFSFKIMGFEMESLILSYLNKDFIFQFLTISLKIFFLYFFYFASLESMLGYFWKDRKIDYRVVFPVFFLFTLLPWVHSVVLYPQVYADFFYGRHSYLLPFLYFLTDHIHPQYPLYLLIVLLFGYLLFILYKLFRTAEFQYITILIYLSLFAIWHYRGDFLGLAITYFVFKFFQIYSAARR